jgi:predicted transcriptional regulator
MKTSETQTKQVKVQIDIDGIHFESSGTAEELVPQILQFVSRTIPTYDLARKLMYVPDLAGLADRVSEFAKMTNNNQLLLTRNELPAERSISVVLFMAHLTAKFGKRASESLNTEEIATAVNKAPKTIRNTIIKMQKVGLIERSDRGNYRITQKGLMELENALKLTPRTQF